MKDLFLLILCILHKKKLSLQHCFTNYILYGTELHLDSILRGGIRHRTRTADFFRQLRCLSGNDGLYIRLVEDCDWLCKMIEAEISRLRMVAINLSKFGI